MSFETPGLIPTAKTYLRKYCIMSCSNLLSLFITFFLFVFPLLLLLERFVSVVCGFLAWINNSLTFSQFSFFFSFYLLTEKKIISLNIQSVTTYRTISNVIGYLKGTVFPGKQPFIICTDYLFHNGWESQLGSGFYFVTLQCVALLQRKAFVVCELISDKTENLG